MLSGAKNIKIEEAKNIMTKTEKAMFRVAKSVSELSDHPQHKLGCAVVNKHRVISTGFNSQTRYHPLQAKIDANRFGCECKGCVHSETAALLPLIRDGVDLSKAAIYIYREHKNGTLAMARPCPGCESLIRACGIKKIYYTTEASYKLERW